MKIEAAERGAIQKPGLIGRGNNQTSAPISIHKLEEGRDNAAHLPYVLVVTTSLPDRIKLIEEINAGSLGHFGKHRPKMACGRPEEAGKECCQADCQKGDAQLSRQHCRCERFATTRGPAEEQVPPRSNLVSFEVRTCSVLPQDTHERLPCCLGQNDVAPSLHPMASFQDIGKLRRRLSVVGEDTSPFSAHRHLRHETSDLLGDPRVACTTLRRGEGQRGLPKCTIVPMYMGRQKLSEYSCSHVRDHPSLPPTERFDWICLRRAFTCREPLWWGWETLPLAEVCSPPPPRRSPGESRPTLPTTTT